MDVCTHPPQSVVHLMTVSNPQTTPKVSCLESSSRTVYYLCCTAGVQVILNYPNAILAFAPCNKTAEFKTLLKEMVSMSAIDPKSLRYCLNVKATELCPRLEWTKSIGVTLLKHQLYTDALHGLSFYKHVKKDCTGFLLFFPAILRNTCKSLTSRSPTRLRVGGYNSWIPQAAEV